MFSKPQSISLRQTFVCTLRFPLVSHGSRGLWAGQCRASLQEYITDSGSCVINSQSSVSSKLLITYRNSACNSSPFTFSFPPSVSLKHIVLFWEREKETEFMSFMNGYCYLTKFTMHVHASTCVLRALRHVTKQHYTSVHEG